MQQDIEDHITYNIRYVEPRFTPLKTTDIRANISNLSRLVKVFNDAGWTDSERQDFNNTLTNTLKRFTKLEKIAEASVDRKSYMKVQIERLKEVYPDSIISLYNIEIPLGQICHNFNGMKINLGNFTMKVSPSTTYSPVAFKSDNKNGGGFGQNCCHPHAYQNYGSVCLGQWKRHFTKAIKAYDLLTVAAIGQQFLNSYNASDAFANPASFVYCEDCGNRVSSCECNAEPDQE